MASWHNLSLFRDYNKDFISSREMQCCLGALAEVGVFEKVDLSCLYKQRALHLLQGQRLLFSFEVLAPRMSVCVFFCFSSLPLSNRTSFID